MIFGRNGTEKVSNQQMLLFSDVPRLCFFTTRQNGRHGNLFMLQCCAAFCDYRHIIIFQVV